MEIYLKGLLIRLICFIENKFQNNNNDRDVILRENSARRRRMAQKFSPMILIFF